MERLMHYVWQHHLYIPTFFTADSGQSVEVISPGLHNFDAGPDFLAAKVRVGDILWVGDVELHRRSSDWYRHGHEANPAYDNVVLHVCGKIDRPVFTHSGRQIPQIALSVPERLKDNYEELLREERFPPCYRLVPQLEQMEVNAWLAALTVERLNEKAERIACLLRLTGNDWEQACFVTLARNFGFGVNADAFETWAQSLPLSIVGKHCDDLFQLEALFIGQAGLLAPEAVLGEHRDDHYARLCSEYAFLARKFSLTPLPYTRWKFLRLRPQNFPYIRLSQLAFLFHNRAGLFASLMEEADVDKLRKLLATHVTPYWETHYSFGQSSRSGTKTLQRASLNLLLMNTVAPLLFAYGQSIGREDLVERATGLLERLPAEKNFITRSWEAAELRVRSAADSQALVQLRRNYCDRRDCLRCRFGKRYLQNRHIQEENN